MAWYGMACHGLRISYAYLTQAATWEPAGHIHDDLLDAYEAELEAEVELDAEEERELAEEEAAEEAASRSKMDSSA